MSRKGFRNINKKNLSQINRKLGELNVKKNLALEKNDYKLALDCCLKAIDLSPYSVQPYIDASIYCCKINLYQDSVKFGLKALQLNVNADEFTLYDVLAESYGVLYNLKECKKYGSMALNKRNELFGLSSTLDWEVHIENNQELKLISFSLFGDNPKYCEGAILNAEKMSEIYPDFQMIIFYDKTVPENVLQRLEKFNVKLIEISDDLKDIPGPSWRFLAYDLPNSLVIFRDVDSLISIEEKMAVDQWIESDKVFHHIRDGVTHTELILAGLWGVKKGGLPNMSELLKIYAQKPIESFHFFDQYFLREVVWFYAKQSLFAHDSKFDFGDFHPLPKETDYRYFHIGATESLAELNAKFDLEDNSLVEYKLIDNKTDQPICSYKVRVLQKQVQISLPTKYTEFLKNEQWRIEFQ